MSTLFKKLLNQKILIDKHTTNNTWSDYVTRWQSDIKDLMELISEEWLVDFKTEGLLKTYILPRPISEQIIRFEYNTIDLQLNFINHMWVNIYPKELVTLEYNGSITIFKSNEPKNYIVLKRELTKDDNTNWFILDGSKKIKFTKKYLHKLLESWIK